MYHSLFIFLVITALIVLITFYLIFCESSLDKLLSRFKDGNRWKIGCFAVFIIIVLGFISICIHDVYLKFSFRIDPELASKFGSFVGGLFGPLFAIITIFCIVYQMFLQENARKKDNLNRAISEYKKDITDKFYKHLDIHMQDLFALNVKNVIADNENGRSGGRRAFVVFRIQIKYIIKVLETLSFWGSISQNDQMKIIFVIFYHGYSKKWKDDFKEIMMSEVLIEVDRVDEIITLLENDCLKMVREDYKQIKFIERKLSHWCRDCCCRIQGSGFQYKLLRSLDSINRFVSFLEEESPSFPKIFKDKKGNDIKVNITRTNLTSVSSYFENMFFAINLIDKAEHFDLNEKRNLVDMFICQLSEPEKFISFFYLRSSFGEKWESEKLLKYNLLSGLTKRYCFEYDPDILRKGIARCEYSIKN